MKTTERIAIVMCCIAIGFVCPGIAWGQQNVIQDKSILELQPAEWELGDYFPPSEIDALTSRGYSFSKWQMTEKFGSKEDMKTFLGYIMDTSSGMLFYGGHGGNSGVTEGIRMSSLLEVLIAIDWLEQQDFRIGPQDLVPLDRGDGTWSIAMDNAFLNGESKSREAAIIATCSGTLGSTFNAAARVTGPDGSCTNVDLIASIGCLIDAMTSDSLTATFGDAASACSGSLGLRWVLSVQSGKDTQFIGFCGYRTPEGPPRVAIPTCSSDDGPLADVSSFDVFDGTVAWFVDRENGTQEYVIEGCYSMDGPGDILGGDDAGLGWHKFVLPGAARVRIQIRKFPTPQSVGTGNLSFRMVAGTRDPIEEIGRGADVVELGLERHGQVLALVAA